ncbi:MAG TPA: TrkH family potassium uptake protein [Prolixibacteraceae bacterium]|nr:TrkH family potassium uptake protein [Prolixibacteraceae bacterium]
MSLSHLKAILRVLSFIFLVQTLSAIYVIPIALIYGEDTMPFLYSIAVTFTIFLLIRVTTRKNIEFDLRNKEGYIIVVSGWLLLVLLGVLPYLFSQSIPRFVDALFESVSGYTTTGSSILSNIEALPKSILYWRSLSHWIGGIGIISLVIIILPTINVGGYRMFSLESSLQEKMHPRMRSVGFTLLFIYLILTFSQVILMMIGGMNWFESLCHAYGTVATGGFSPKNDSLASYSPYIQYIATLFMFLAGVNFMVHYFIFKRNFKISLQNEEFLFYLKVVGFFTLLVTMILFFQTNMPLEVAFRNSVFNVVSIISCTGFCNTDYMLWPVLGWLFMFLLLFSGGSTGSTSGGIKMARHLIVIKNIKATLFLSVHRNSVYPIKLNGRPISDENNRSVLAFVALYLMTFMILTLMLIADGVDIPDAASAIATGMSGTGPGLFKVGPVGNFEHFHDFSKIIMSIAMFTGRLEILTLFAVFTRTFWRN